MLPKMSPFEDLVWKHIRKRKTPISAAQLAKYFIVSTAKARAALKFFEDSDLVDVIKLGATKYYKSKQHEEKNVVVGNDNNEVL